MQVIKIETTPRADFGKKASRALRREGLVPGVLYGGGETVSFTVSAKALKPLIYTPNSYIVELVIDGKTEKAVMRAVPVRLTGNAEGVKVGGKLVLSTRKLVVSGMVDKLPDEITVDVTSLGVGKTIFVGDLKSDDLKFLTPATTAICAVRVTRASRSVDQAAQ